MTMKELQRRLDGLGQPGASRLFLQDPETGLFREAGRRDASLLTQAELDAAAELGETVVCVLEYGRPGADAIRAPRPKAAGA